MKYLIIYLEVEHLLNFLTQEEKGDLLDVLIKYAKDEIDPTIENKRVANVFNFLKSKLDQQFAKAKLKAEVARANGASGGRPAEKRPKRTNKNPVGTQANPENPVGYFKPKKAKKEIKENYLSLSEGLIFVLESKMNKTFQPSTKNSWAKEIKKLIEIDLKNRTTAEDDVKIAIQAIADNYGKDYFPIIQSGSSLREKFTKIEAYLQRNKPDFLQQIINNAQNDR